MTPIAIFTSAVFCLSVSLSGAQNKPIELEVLGSKPNWPHTAKYAKVLKFSEEWSKQEKQVDERIKALKSDSKAGRRKKFETLPSQPPTRFMDASDAIYALRFMKEFWTEVSTLRGPRD